ncbi:hypothetical protein [Aquibacillus sediminis]|uniref:hypothetical protein n=1 Tax=Aquibacillus sediminis TaxID=2574734 RepID=UPI001109288D|nr:hypothetical protein [Aquibacillus sediminis]
MGYIIRSMALPVDNLVGMLLYALLFMFLFGLTTVLALRLIPNPLPYILKSAIVGTSVLISLLLWLVLFVI